MLARQHVRQHWSRGKSAHRTVFASGPPFGPARKSRLAIILTLATPRPRPAPGHRTPDAKGTMVCQAVSARRKEGKESSGDRGALEAQGDSRSREGSEGRGQRKEEEGGGGRRREGQEEGKRCRVRGKRRAFLASRDGRGRRQGHARAAKGKGQKLFRAAARR